MENTSYTLQLPNDTLMVTAHSKKSVNDFIHVFASGLLYSRAYIVVNTREASERWAKWFESCANNSHRSAHLIVDRNTRHVFDFPQFDVLVLDFEGSVIAPNKIKIIEKPSKKILKQIDNLIALETEGARIPKIVCTALYNQGFTT